MVRAGIAELKSKLSHFLRITRAGEDVIITDRGRAVARLVPLHETVTDIPAHLEEMARRSEVRIGVGLEPKTTDLPRPKVKQGFSAVQALVDERRGGR